jgi:hypothetical protein
VQLFLCGGVNGTVPAVELLALVKHDCPVCDQLLPALDAAGIDVVSQSSLAETDAQAQRLGLGRVPRLDDDLAISERFDPDAVPTVVLLDGGEERARVEGLDTARLAELASEAGVDLDLAGMPPHRPGCASLTRDPEVALRLAARRARAEGRLQARTLTVGGLEDPIEALHDRGLTDGLPVVPPTAERVVALLEGTSRDPRDVVAEVPPYGGRATVEKVAINAVMAGCLPEHLPVVLAAVEAACDEAFALHGLLATTMPAGPLVVVSGPLADEIGMESGGNLLGQGSRANLSIGRALQLVVRNVGGGRPRREDRATHGQMGKVGACFAERLDETAPWEGLAQARGVPDGETGVTLMSAEAPRVVVDQLGREPESLAATLAFALESVASPRQRLAFDAMLLVGPEHGRVFRQAGWSRERLQQELFERTTSPAGTLVRGAGGSGEGLLPEWVTDPEAGVPKFAAPDRILVTYGGGDAGLFSMVFGGWAAGEIGSAPVTRSVQPWL